MDWYPDWSGETCAILACGPSASAEQAERVRGRARLVVVNCAWRLAPLADLLYACDPQWWVSEAKGYGQHALRDFPGIKVGYAKPGHDPQDGVHYVGMRHVNELVTEPGVIGNGLNSGWQALNLAVQLGARKILLLGFDMRMVGNRLHCHKDHPKPLGNPTPNSLHRYLAAFNDSEAKLRQMGVEVINCTPGSVLNVFPKMEIEEALCPAPAS